MGDIMKKCKKLGLLLVAALFASPLFCNVAFGDLARINATIPNEANYNWVELWVSGYNGPRPVCGTQLPAGTGIKVEKNQGPFDACVPGGPGPGNTIPDRFYIDVRYPNRHMPDESIQVHNPNLLSTCKINLLFPDNWTGEIHASPTNCAP